MEPACKKKHETPAEGLYVHVPFCSSKCRYCDFYSLPAPSADAMDAYLYALADELARFRDILAHPVGSIFIGGGTPTALGGARLGRLLSLLADLRDAATEVTVEANPASLDAEVLAALADAGVGRVSLGAQSFQDAELQTLGRTHRAADVARAIDALADAGMGRRSVDLIFGVPGQTPATWAETLAAAAALPIEHVSAYALSVESGTPLAADIGAGRLQPIDEETQRTMFDQAGAILAAAGLARYELSNYARPGAECRQNLLYWRNDSYLGVGPAACSYLAGVRRSTTPNLAAWLAWASTGCLGDPPGEAERLTGLTAAGETLMLGLRLTAGVDLQTFQARHGGDPAELLPASAGRHEKLGHLLRETGRLRLAERVLFTADAVLADIVEEAGR